MDDMDMDDAPSNAYLDDQSVPPTATGSPIGLSGSDNDDVDEVSDADSDYLELQADIARLDASRNAFLSEHLGPDAVAPAATGASGTAVRRRRGPRKAAEPSAEVKFRLQQAHQLFMDNRYEDALEALHEIIRVNAETHAAWNLLASINEDLGRREESLMARVFAAHLEPKNVAGWLSTADFALAEAAAVDAEEPAEGDNDDDIDDDDGAREEERQNRRLQNLQIARLCYSGAIRADKDNIPARLGKANVCLEFGQATNAATEYVRVLKRRPLALQVIRNLAEASYDSVRGSETIQAAIKAYRKAVAYLRGKSSVATHGYFAPYLTLDDGEEFSWMDITIYVELYAAMEQYKEAIAVLKNLARWMLGRGGPDEAYWKDVDKDESTNCEDGEWDRHDEPRRRKVPGFQPGRYPLSAYGEGLPVDLRAKLAIYRLKLGHEEEAIEHLAWIDPQDANTTESMRLYPHLLKDVGAELFGAKRFELALQYLELYRELNRAAVAGGLSGGYEQMTDEIGEGGDANSSAAADDDADALVLQGKCNLELHDHAAAEECFLAAIEADDENIDARYELAKMYEKAQEKEQAYILVNEALSLEAAQQKRQQLQTRDEEGDEQEEGAVAERAVGDGATDGAAPGKRRGPMASLETAAYRVFLDSEGKVVRRHRKFRKGPDGQDILVSTERKRRTKTAQGQEGEEGDQEGGVVGPDGELRVRRRQPKTGTARVRGPQRRPQKSQQQQRRWRAVRGHARRFFASPAEQAEFEASTSARLRGRYQVCRALKERADAGDVDAAAEWMEAAKELIDDFRSFREFYTWDKYVQFLGVNNFLHDQTGTAAAAPATAAVEGAGTSTSTSTGPGTGQHSSHLTALAERLHQNLTPADAEAQVLANAMIDPALLGPATAAAPAPLASARRDYRGIPFDDWLALFLEYALGLAHAGRTTEAYAVCQSAHDSTVYRQEDSMFLIHLAWASCAVRAGDEQTCVAVARYFMREQPYTTDCYRLFTTMCRLCRSPSMWFSSSPAQKYILRQIRSRDEAIKQEARAAGKDETAVVDRLDTCLLVVYGHILFASMSYHFALNYYQRALAVDPGNPVISLCIGLSYVHWALKRQADNRQYLLTQGFHFLYRYAGGRLAAATKTDSSDDAHARREAYYNLGRAYHLLGLHALAAEFYGKVLRETDPNKEVEAANRQRGRHPDLRTEAAYNLRTYYLLAGNHEAAMQVARAYLVL
ncbi:general transcription factor 3C polypeptide 3 (transcription factor C subunit 4) [Sporothrix schenckii 1099-18]|uniref:General transcription factor 3C polypeptide 3 (Transcription factor C subunit 4) n=1 Tax=Sporothrix schenckii 1099-18 TaxID=1397361 RepID=A0A0F2MHZ1_SPOSC|nr:general transcription factor 3C polypeptide 3 (transcription factor C subunit 4) [Sporothrix schenckii 1099-18]KJR87796.1 general transcription factor 3C polypeptide 3 (transcription factor C subunit 4) [Sporothrix schenckii 1099-18]